jgi:hypothetical protein
MAAESLERTDLESMTTNTLKLDKGHGLLAPEPDKGTRSIVFLHRYR